MKVYPILLLAVLIGISSCSSNSENEPTDEFPTFEINDRIIQSPEEVLGEVEFIPLKIPEGTPIQFFGFDPNMAVSEDRIFLNTDPYMNPSLHEFDLKGNHIQSIARKDGGPNEYESIDKLGLNAEGNLMVVSRASLLEFDEKLDIQKRINLRQVGSYFLIDFHPLDEKKWLVALRGTDPEEDGFFKNFAVFNSDSLTYDFLDLKSYPASGSGEAGSLVPYEEGFLLNFGASDKIFYYSKGDIQPILSFNSGDRSMPHESRLQPEDKADEELERMIATQTYDFYFGNVEVAGETINTQVFGITPKPLSPSELEEMEEIPSDFPVYELFFHPKKQQIKASKIVPGLGGFPFSDGEYFYRLLYTETWNSMLESKHLGEKHTQALQLASEQLADMEDPIVIRYKIKWD
ncbi:6-bladed beta-propeller [Algoriphagus marincola]|uniref:6-bladed beta-propeller n=1 Tax=Algoriphagus marincola TaxID=264027 RepID=A0ABS7N752_9BACT|nr:6-bladed beta-propeller [Algoriphagus marincola]MBY5952172.1 6-bladed beta-propeller [Algoriphagus marincola]